MPDLDDRPDLHFNHHYQVLAYDPRLTMSHILTLNGFEAYIKTEPELKEVPLTSSPTETIRRRNRTKEASAIIRPIGLDPVCYLLARSDPRIFGSRDVSGSLFLL